MARKESEWDTFKWKHIMYKINKWDEKTRVEWGGNLWMEYFKKLRRKVTQGATKGDTKNTS